MLFWFSISPAHANDIHITNSILVPSEGENPARIQFNIRWENSWRHPFSTGINNWDAAWVFIKYRDVGNTSAAWSHLYLSNTPGEYAAGTWQGEGDGGAVIDPGLVDPRLDGSSNLITPYSPAVNGNPSGQNPIVGAFVYRENVGRGRFEAEGVGFAFNPEENGIDADKLYDFKVFAIEMVYVPQGRFYVGDGTTDVPEGIFRDGSTTLPFLIGSEAALTLGGSAAGSLTATATSASPSDFIQAPQSLPEAFPKGFSAFYLMKYEASQRQYVDFLNTLTRSQQEARFSSTTVGDYMPCLINPPPSTTCNSGAPQTTPINRNGVRLIRDPGGTAPRVFGNDLNPDNPADESDDGQWIAMNWMSWMDGTAYVDWAGLRPMTELEFEKSARGPMTPVANERAWGNNSATAAEEITDTGRATEVAPDVGGINANIADNNRPGVQGPLRVGSFARSATSRSKAGASYWGVMELSGNLWERTVSVGNVTGRAFTGLHGDGGLDSSGNADVALWPGTDAVGSGFRGGAWSTSSPSARVSDRANASATNATRSGGLGYRGVRTAGCLFEGGPPQVPVVVDPPTEVLPGRIVTVTTSLAGHSGGFTWTITSDDWVIISGQGTASVKVKAGFQNAKIDVAAVSPCGSGPFIQGDLFSSVLAMGGKISSYVADGTNGESGTKYIVHTFDTPGPHTFQPLVKLENVDYILVAGGGGGGGTPGGQEGSGGGGAGGLLTSFSTPAGGTGVLTLNPTAYALSVGAGGPVQSKGGNTTAFGLVAEGGGYGGTNGGTNIGGNGGSGGGGSGFAGAKAGGSGNEGPPRQGFAGGTGPHTTNQSGGGGGAGSAGNSQAGGGAGLSYTITGAAVTYAAGGNGGTSLQGAASNTFGGGGGGGGRSAGNTQGTPGKDGVVIIRYKAAGN